MQNFSKEGCPALAEIMTKAENMRAKPNKWFCDPKTYCHPEGSSFRQGMIHIFGSSRKPEPRVIFKRAEEYHYLSKGALA